MELTPTWMKLLDEFILINCLTHVHVHFNWIILVHIYVNSETAILGITMILIRV